VLLLPEKLSALTAIATDPVTVTPSDGLVIVTVNREFATTTEVEVSPQLPLMSVTFSRNVWLPFGTPRSDVSQTTSLRFPDVCASRSRCDRGTAQTCLNCRWCRRLAMSTVTLPLRVAPAEGARIEAGNGGVRDRRQYASWYSLRRASHAPSPSACAVPLSYGCSSPKKWHVPTMSGFTPSLM